MLFKRIREDIEAFMTRDPAAQSKLEVILCYSGLHAVMYHCLSHALWKRGWRVLGRFISHFGKIMTGIEIHPAAKIGRRLVIDHGTGVVIGETSEIGDDVTLYHGVTLGGISPSVDSASQVNIKRHPTLLDGAIVGSGAQILGPITVGKEARVGSNAVVTTDVPGGMTAVGIPARIVMPRDKSKISEFVAYGEPADGCPDVVLTNIEELRNQVALLINKVGELETRLGDDEAEKVSGDSKQSKIMLGGKG
ncbi:MAG: serine O-acetyltransferase [Rhodospirillales bacterium]